MSKSNPKVIILATSCNTRGGITSVINAHKQGKQWNAYQCKWIETHIDKNVFAKLFYLLKAFCLYIIILPFYDIVHVHFSEPVSAFRKTIFILLARFYGKKIIIHFHSFSPETTIKGRFSTLYKFLFLKADRVIVLSNYWKTEINQRFNISEKIVIIYNPCVINKFDGKYDKLKQILFAGTINERKGYIDLIKAFAMVASVFPDWKIVFAGSGEIESAKKLVNSLLIGEQIEFVGWVKGIEKDKIFKESMIFCLPSYAEGFPMALLDALAYGLPSIVTPVGGIPDIAKDYENMLLFEPGDIDLLSKKIRELIEDTDLRKKLSVESLRLAETTFDINVINMQLDNIYKGII